VPTSLMLKERRTATTARVTYYRRHGPGSRLHPADLDADRIRGADAVHLTGITPALSESARETVRVAAQLARGFSVPVTLDFNYRSSLWEPDDAARALAELCGLVDVAFVGYSEARALGYPGDPLDVARAVQALGPTTVVVKLGRRGALALDGDDVTEVEAASVEAVDPVGAGDAFAAGYLAELLCGRSLLARLETAAACGAFAVSAYGDWEALPSRADLHLVSRPAGTVMR
jgi:2-dehydro-3-deoxygluconokinase